MSKRRRVRGSDDEEEEELKHHDKTYAHEDDANEENGKGKVSAADGENDIKKPVKVLEKNNEGNAFLPLSAKRRLTISQWKGETLIDIRDFYEKNGNLLPGNKGISITSAQWEKISKHIKSIDAEIEKLN